jgi:hypothetical protein
MTGQNPLKSFFTKKLLLPVIATMALVLPILSGTIHRSSTPTAVSPNLEAASITPIETDAVWRPQSTAGLADSLAQRAAVSSQNVMQQVHYDLSAQDRVCNGPAFLNTWIIECEAERLLPYLYLLLTVSMLIVVRLARQTR